MKSVCDVLIPSVSAFFCLTMTRRTWPNTKSYSEFLIKSSPYDGHTHFNCLLSARFRCQLMLRKHVTSSSGSKVCTLQATSMVHITFTCSCNIFNTVRCKLRFSKTHALAQHISRCSHLASSAQFMPPLGSNDALC